MPHATLVALTTEPNALDQLQEAVEEDLGALGLHASAIDWMTDPVVVAGTARFVRRTVAVCHFEGPADRGMLDAIAALQADGVQVFVTVGATSDFATVVPPSLQAINGTPLTAPATTRVAHDLLTALGLLRRSRRVFLSYRRVESTGVARQLASALDLLGYEVFLDTKSIPLGRDFQADLWDHLVDVDVQVFLHSPTAVQSDWVDQELRRAAEAGIGVVDLTWPGVAPLTTAVAQVEALDHADLVGTDAIDQTLTDPCLDQLLATIERVRTSAFRQRHTTLVGEFVARATRDSRSAVVRPDGEVWMYDDTTLTRRVVPVIGRVEASHLYDLYRRGPDLTLLYDDRLYTRERKDLVTWMLYRLRQHAVRHEEVATWLRT